MKKLFLLFAFCIPFFASAQNNDKYLAGAVTTIDGRVTFKAETSIPNMTQEQFFTALLDWANQRFQPDGKMNARVLYQNPEEGSIAIGGEEYLVFSSTALALDRTRIYYQLKLFCETGKCDIEMTRIRYWYNETRDGGEKYDAEEWITDEWALNKSKTKLAPISGKFRRKTIDLYDGLLKEIQAALGNKLIELGLETPRVTPESKVKMVAVSSKAENPAEPTEVESAKTEPVKTEPIKAAPQTPNEENLIAQAARMTITAGNDEQFEISKECWGGFGELFGKKVAFCLIDTQKTMGNLLMTQSENYTISFYTANNIHPAVVIRCKKLMAQTIDGKEAQKAFGAVDHKLRGKLLVLQDLLGHKGVKLFHGGVIHLVNELLNILTGVGRTLKAQTRQHVIAGGRFLLC